MCFSSVSGGRDPSDAPRRWRRVVAFRAVPDPVVAAIQLTSTDDVARNLERAAALVRAATRDGANLIGLPENFAYLGSDLDHRLSIAEPLPPGGPAGPILSAMQDLARELGVWLLL